MKRKYIVLAVLLLSAFIYSCEKNAVQIITKPVSGAQVKFFNFALGAPSVNFYAGPTKVSAIVSTTGVESTTGTAFSFVFPLNNSYAVLTPGTYDMTARIPTSVTVDPNLAIATLNTQLLNGKNYSLYTSGLYNTTTKSADAFIVEDNLPPVDTSGTFVRFVHASHNANPLNLVIRNTTTSVETIVATGIPYKSASEFVKVNSGVYDLILRYPGSTTNVVLRTGVNLIKAFTNTFSLRGDITITSTTLANRPVIDNTPNR